MSFIKQVAGDLFRSKGVELQKGTSNSKRED